MSDLDLNYTIFATEQDTLNNSLDRLDEEILVKLARLFYSESDIR